MALPYVLTLIVDRAHGALPPAVIATARGMVQGTSPEILSPGEAVDIPCPAPLPGAPGAAALRAAFAPHRIDAIFQRARGRRKAVLVADMDSTIVAGETLDDLARLAGCGDEVTAITDASMSGEMPFDEALRQRVRLLRGQPSSLLEDTWASTRLNDDARTLVQTMRAHNARTALVSGGFTWFTARVAEMCGFDEHHGNVLGLDGDALTGELEEPILGPDAKEAHLLRLTQERGVRQAATLAIGDGANDIPMLMQAGLGLAFHGRPRLRGIVERQINFSGLRAALFAQGYPLAAFVD